MKHAAAAAVAGLALVLGAAAAGTARASGPGTWTLAYQVPEAGVFSDLAAISRTDAWAVGYPYHGNSPVQLPIIRHYDGTGWKAVTIPGARFEADRVAASSARNVWVYGLAAGHPLDASVAYRYDGSRWHKVPVPPPSVLSGMVTFGASNTWAIGASGTADVFHWNGSSWHGYDLDLLPVDISASSGSNVWVAGLGADQKVVAYRWNGSGWHAAVMPHPVIDIGPTVLASAPSDVWIAWDTFTATVALHWDGHHWHQITVPATVDADGSIARDGIGGHWFGPFARLDGSTWTGLSFPPAPGGADYPRAPVLIPGTTSAWLPASEANSASSAPHATIYHLSLRRLRPQPGSLRSC